jgi:hypothetical protein
MRPKSFTQTLVPTYAAQYSRIAKTSVTLRRKSEDPEVWCSFLFTVAEVGLWQFLNKRGSVFISPVVLCASEM